MLLDVLFINYFIYQFPEWIVHIPHFHAIFCIYKTKLLSMKLSQTHGHMVNMRPSGPLGVLSSNH